MKKKKNPLLQISESFVNSSLFFIFFFLASREKNLFRGADKEWDLMTLQSWKIPNIVSFSDFNLKIYNNVLKKIGTDNLCIYIYSIWFVSLQISLHSLNLES